MVAPYASNIGLALFALTSVLTFIDFFIYPISIAGLRSANAGIGLARDRMINTFDIKAIDQRQILFDDRYGDQGLSLMETWESLGYMRQVSRDKTRTFEGDWIHQTVFLSTNGGAAFVPDADYNNAGTAGAGLGTIILGNSGTTNSFIQYDNGSSYPTDPLTGAYTGNPAYLQSASTNLYSFPLQVNDRLRFRKGEVAHVKSISGSGTNVVTVTIKFANFNNKILASDYSVGDEIAVIGNAWPNGSLQPRGNQQGVIQNWAYTQIIKGGFGWDGANATDQEWFTEIYTEENGVQVNKGYVVRGQARMEYEMNLDCDSALLFERPQTNYLIGTDGDGTTVDEPVRSTEGAFPATERGGHNFNYAIGGWSMQNFDAMEKTLNREYAPLNQAFLQGFDLQQEVATVMKDYNQNTGVDYVSKKTVNDLFGGNEVLAMTVNFGYYKKTKYNWFFVPLPQLTNPRTQPAGYNTGYWGLTLPLGKTMDPKTKTAQPYFGVIYKGQGNESRKRITWTLNGPNMTRQILTERDTSTAFMLSEIGAEHRALNKRCLWKPA